MKKNKRKLTPKLRFPEFRDGPYHKVRLGDVAEDATERNRKTLDADVVMGVFKGEGMRPMERRLVANNISRYKVVEKDWFAYNPMRLNIGSIARWSGDEPVLVSPDYIVFRCSNDSGQKIDPNYLDHFRYSDQWDRFVTLSGDGSVRVRIYFRDIATLRLILPSLSEQQKIAECLSSLDGLIAAEGRKLAALKAHKKGLMQQIFPGTPTSSSAGGESAGGDAGAPSQPRLRFPEFRDKGEWEERQLGDVADVLMCKRIFANETNVTGGVPFYKIGTLGGTPDAYIRKTLFKEYKSKYNFPRKGEILITCSGTIGKCLQYDGGDAYFQDSNIVWIDNPTLVLRAYPKT